MFTDFKIGMDFFMGSAAFLEDKSMTDMYDLVLGESTRVLFR
jgi:hypothetical protein